MRYSDLVQFEPIETVIQLRDADKEKDARELVNTYVISERMAKQLVDLVIPQIQFQKPHDNKGVLIVGNYGTGKSHLMSVISAVAEYEDLAKEIKHKEVQKAAKAISGKFKVVRVEIGGVTASLRDILLGELEEALKKWKTPYKFPPADQITNNKNFIIEAVAKFQEKYPDHGILLVVDELLDYLRTREQRALILDLGFLRELGEVAASTPFRFVGGLQELLFDSPRFTFVADQLRRVKDRFEQVTIAREDIAFVVANRLLQKDNKQLAKITEHLRQFTPLYKQMAERLNEFAQLFPIHPAYISTFEQVYIAEKREVLRTLSQAMRQLLDKEVPTNEPGLVSFDSYWSVLRDNASLRSMEGVAKVIEKSDVLEGRIKNAYTREQLKPMATRIIHALSIHRLTTSDIYVPLGVTAEELRDNLCLYTRTPEATGEFLLDQVQVALKEIIRTVQGQFITYNAENSQYYLDLKKAVDFDAKIEERGEFMERSDLNTYFFDALHQTLNLGDTTYVTNYNIWFYELPWGEHKVTRPGYLFFGAPDERSTAQPPRDFYLYWLPPFPTRKGYHDEHKSDEVILELSKLDNTFEQKVRLYAGSKALANESTEYRKEYADSADGYLRILTRWLRDNLNDHLQVIYQGKQEPVSAVLKRAKNTASQTIEELLRVIASSLLSPDFEERFPEYPTFKRASQVIAENARTASAMDAIYHLGGRSRTNLAATVLEGLELLDADGNIRPYESRYAEKFLQALTQKPENQVLNRGELIEIVAGGIVPIEKDVYFHLEPEWVVVILLALVYNGDIVLNVDGREEIDANTLNQVVTRSIKDLMDFRFFKRPRTLPLPLWTSIFEGLGLPPGLIRDENKRDEAVKQLMSKVNEQLERVARLDGRMREGVKVWNTSLFTDNPTMIVEAGTVVGSNQPDVTLNTSELLAGLRGSKKFLEELSKFNTVGKLRNLKFGPSDIKDGIADLERVTHTSELVDLVSQIQPMTTYLAEATANLPADHPWVERAQTQRKALLDDLRRLAKGEKQFKPNALTRELEKLKTEYINTYAELHRQLTLGPKADGKRRKLYDDPRLKALEALVEIDLLGANGRSELNAWKGTIGNLPPCPDFHDGLLKDSPTCPACHLRPANKNTGVSADESLKLMDDLLDKTLTRWRQALRTNLGSDTVKHSLDAMSPKERKPIEAFLAQSEDEPTLPEGFVRSASQALHGIEALTIPVDALLEALKTGGLPTTVDELQRRFGDYIQKTMRGHDPRNTRLNLNA
jgi:hypothetical protein